MPGYSGFVPNELGVKTEGGQWSPPKFLNVANKQGPKPYANLGANPPPPINGPPRSVVFSRDGVFVQGGTQSLATAKAYCTLAYLPCCHP